MNRKRQLEIISGYYSHLPDFRGSRRQDSEGGCVYSAADGSYRLVLAGQGINNVQARLFDGDGMRRACDTYSVRNSAIQIIEARWADEHGGEVKFSPDELGVLHQFTDGGKKGTLAMLRAVVSVIKDGQIRAIVEQTAEKVERLPDSVCGELIATTKRRCRMENERSIRSRLARAKEQSKGAVAGREKGRKAFSRDADRAR